jgi:2-polyprenyl-6-methoxyphenol hydroxylase-like FAD-dependent oxidoreductase
VKVVICGAGIAGLALAAQVSRLGGEVVVLERAPGARAQGYMIDFFGPGYDAAEAMGLLPAIREVAYHFDEASFIDERGRRRAGVVPQQFAGGPLLSLMRPDLERVLREHLPHDVGVWFGTAPVGVTDLGDGVVVTLDDGAEIRADLLVGADGVHSTIRGLVLGDESRFLRYLGMHIAAFVFDSPGIHAALSGKACLTDTVDRVMGFYGLRDGRVAGFAVHRSADAALPGDARTAVRAAYAGMGWVVPEALERCPPSSEVFYDQVAQVVIPRWHRGRVALVGDACYAVSVLAGQGASLAVAGGYVLAELLARARSVDAALADYQRVWRPVAEEKQKAGRAAAGWFLPSSAVGVHLRRLTLRLARLPLVDRFVNSRLIGTSAGPIPYLRLAAGAAPRPIGSDPPVVR